MAIVVGAGIAATATVASSANSADSARSAAHQQQDAANAQQAAQTAAQKPWMDAGKQALDQLTTGLSPGGQWSKPFSMADAKNSDAEQHALQQGSQAIQNSAAAKGGLIGTNTLQDLTTFAQSNASQFENQAFNQWLSERNAQMAPLQSLAGLGQTSTSQVADNNTNLALAGANAGAAGTIGRSNAVNSGINSAGSQISTLAGLFGTGGGGTNAYTSPDSSGSYANPGGSAYSYAQTGDQSGIFGSAGDYSDERLKEDIKEVGTTHDGIPIYTYRMRGNPKLKMGVMAQDMERVKPSAVAEGRSGFKMVDYSRV